MSGFSRRRLLSLFAAGGTTGFAGCSGSSSSGTPQQSATQSKDSATPAVTSTTSSNTRSATSIFRWAPPAEKAELNKDYFYRGVSLSDLRRVKPKLANNYGTFEQVDFSSSDVQFLGGSTNYFVVETDLSTNDLRKSMSYSLEETLQEYHTYKIYRGVQDSESLIAAFGNRTVIEIRQSDTTEQEDINLVTSLIDARRSGETRVQSNSTVNDLANRLADPWSVSLHLAEKIIGQIEGATEQVSVLSSGFENDSMYLKVVSYFDSSLEAKQETVKDQLREAVASGGIKGEQVSDVSVEVDGQFVIITGEPQMETPSG